MKGAYCDVYGYISLKLFRKRKLAALVKPIITPIKIYMQLCTASL